MTNLKNDGFKSRFYLFVEDMKALTWKKWLAIIFVVVVVALKLEKLISRGEF